MFTKAFRALSSGSRDRDRLQHEQLNARSASRHRDPWDGTRRQLQEPVLGGVMYDSDSDSDEYGIPQARKEITGRHDPHRRGLSREHATVEHKCPGCGEVYKFKENEDRPPCKYCCVRPYDARKQGNPQLRRAEGSPTSRQIRSPRQLEDSFRDLYRRIGVLLTDDTVEHECSSQQEPIGQPTAPSCEAAHRLHNLVSQEMISPRKSPERENRFRQITTSDDALGAPLRAPPREPPPVPLAKSPLPARLELNGNTSIPSGSISQPLQARSPHKGSRVQVVGSGSPLQMDARTSPRKRMPQAPYSSTGQRQANSASSPRASAKQHILEQFQAEFRTVFGNPDFLNTEFCSTVRPKPSKRSMSEGANRVLDTNIRVSNRKQVTRLESEQCLMYRIDSTKPSNATPDVDPILPDGKALLAGHIHDIVSSMAGDHGIRQVGRSASESQRTTYQSSPHINWSELQAYHSVLIRYTLDTKFCSTLLPPKTATTGKAYSVETEAIQIAASLLACCLEVMYECLTAAREPITAPQGARYLLLILANPWLTRSFEPLASEYQKTLIKISPPLGAQLSASRFDNEARLLLLRDASTNKSSLPIRDAILGLIVGRVANLPDAVQHVYAKWFASVPSEVYQDVVNLVRNYNSIQIKRIPIHDQSSIEEAKRALERSRLNGILGPPNASRLEAGAEMLPWYSKRKSAWRLRSSCQVLQLVVVANDLRADLAARQSSARSRLHITSSTCRQFPVGEFYSVLLDPDAGRFELASDFDLWESRRPRFTLCQYPFLLTLGTKVKILEYDNERRKKDAVRAEWHSSNGMSADPYWQLPVRRDHLIEDSFKVIREARGSLSGLTSKKLRVRFEGEEAVDAGGPQKEWFLILTQELFNPDLGLFYFSDSGYFWFHTACTQPNEYYELVGAVFGLAIYNQTPLFAPFPPFLFRKLAAAAPRIHGSNPSWRHMWRPTLQDYAELSPKLAKVLADGLADPQTLQGLNFEIPVWQRGQNVYQPVMPGGAEREITPSNVAEYVERAVNLVLQDSIKNQFMAFARGFHSICGGNALSLFRGEELELLVRGSEDFDLDTLRAAVNYDNWTHPFRKKDEKLQSEDDVKRYYPVVRFFWDYFERADTDTRRRILRFVTGTDRLPPAGIVNLIIKISRQPMTAGQLRYPSARTCFNQILLPDCFREQVIFDKVFTNALDMAGTGFGMK